ncbi:uncharacterized protein LOC111396370 isoform X2 [Olea europaea var. sylvestris]|uniref:uncharacterized protein LOC111396370 isoform X2 n=1 Tax=Olea europaea var. sylvestris TaxID=158386 RepID=UPI000C1D3F7D|nr:uncharacterized protein LOC111396370 isoform X2 [Olea europaea var. sylvestris]
MGKGDLWDDSALINAFDHAISKYKMMHRSAEGGKPINGNEEIFEVVSKSSEVSSSVGLETDNGKSTSLNATAEIGETVSLSPTEENPSIESGFPEKHIVSSTVQNGNLTPAKENSAVESGSLKKIIDSSNVQNVQDDATWYSQSPEEYNQLLNKYYELESQRQNIVQKLNQCSNWSYEHPVSGTFTPEYNQASFPQSSFQIVTCCCPYGCQSSVACCSSLPVHCSDGACVDKSCDTSRGGYNGNSTSQEDHGFVKTAMVAAERALSSLTNETSQKADASVIGGKGEELQPEVSHLTESTESRTDLDVVLNAWYSAGFFTGKSRSLFLASCVRDIPTLPPKLQGEQEIDNYFKL